MFCYFNKEAYFCIKVKVLESLSVNSVYSIKPSTWNTCAKPLLSQWQLNEFEAKYPSRFQDLQIKGECSRTFFPFMKSWTSIPKSTKRKKEKKKKEKLKTLTINQYKQLKN